MNRLALADPWECLRRLTPARIALGRVGNSLPTQALLAFGVAQAQARDAVFEASQQSRVVELLHSQGLGTLAVCSAAGNRQTYLRRPDLGRQLDAHSRALLLEARPADPPDIVFVVADGLSPLAALRHAPALLLALPALLPGLRWGPVVVADLARVALGDQIGELLGARQLAMLIGERPGLSAPDSLGIYLTHTPRRGRTDAERNCISNVRPQGLAYADAARRLAALVDGARRLGKSGIALKYEGAWHGGAQASPSAQQALPPATHD
jgi:ethanolamine ammonia-lyase small subunit